MNIEQSSASTNNKKVVFNLEEERPHAYIEENSLSSDHELDEVLRGESSQEFDYKSLLIQKNSTLLKRILKEWHLFSLKQFRKRMAPLLTNQSAQARPKPKTHRPPKPTPKLNSQRSLSK